MKVFVSYTRNDGIITTEILKKIHSRLSRRHKVFIHALESLDKEVSQKEVISKLVESDVVILLYTEGCISSPWVNIEVDLAVFLSIPIIPINAHKLKIN
jgi:hypothetical protein